MEKYSNFENFSSNISILFSNSIIIKSENKKVRKDKWNSIKLKPVNPNVGLPEESVKRRLFPSDSTLYNTVTSDDFKKLIETDAGDKDGQKCVAEYYGVTDVWEKLMESSKTSYDESPSGSYYQLLIAVKCASANNNVWISFYEGLHRHSALLLSLLSSSFNMTENSLKNKTLTSKYFKEHELVNFVNERQSPDERLNAIFKKEIEAKMLATKFRVRGLIPKPRGEEDNESTEQMLKLKVDEFIVRISKYSQIISESKKTSAENSLPTLLMKALKSSIQNSTVKQRQYILIRTDNESTEADTKPASPDKKMFRNEPNWNIEHQFKTLTDTKLKTHQDKMESCNRDELKVYQLCKLLFEPEWKAFIKDPLNDAARNAFIDKMAKTATNKKLAPPPYGIYFDSMTISIGKIENGVRHVDQRHLNAYYIIPIIVTILHAKKKNEPVSSVVKDESNVAMINYLCRYIYGMKGYNNNTLHPAVEDYLPEIKKGTFLNDLTEKYQILPVTVFLMTMYNACFMFQKDKTDNDLIKAMTRVTLNRGLDDSTFFSTMSKSLWKNFQILNIFPSSNLADVFNVIGTLSWFVINVSYVIGEKLAKSRKIEKDKGQPQFFYEVVKYWVTYELVKIIEKYGLKPDINENLKSWSKDIYNVVCFLKTEDKKMIEEDEGMAGEDGLKYLFDIDKTVHWAHFQKCTLGTKKHLSRISNFPLPLVVITWQRMLVEHFSKHTDEAFFIKGNYEPAKSTNNKHTLNNLHLKVGETNSQVRSFDDFSIKNELSLGYWADKILQGEAYLVTTKKSNAESHENTYSIKKENIKWEKEKGAVEEGGTVEERDSGEMMNDEIVLDETKKTEQLKTIAEAMNVAKELLARITKKTEKQKNDANTVNRGCILLQRYIEKELNSDNVCTTWEKFMDWLRKQNDTIELMDDESSGRSSEKKDDKGRSDDNSIESGSMTDSDYSTSSDEENRGMSIEDIIAGRLNTGSNDGNELSSDEEGKERADVDAKENEDANNENNKSTGDSSNRDERGKEAEGVTEGNNTDEVSKKKNSIDDTKNSDSDGKESDGGSRKRKGGNIMVPGKKAKNAGKKGTGRNKSA